MESEQIKKLRRRVISEPEFSRLLRIAKDLRADIYLVGGLIRDALLDKDTPDVDVVLSRNSLKAAARFAEKKGGTLVLLRETGGLARVVLQGRTFDFAEFRGPDLLSDLADRDFTINAVALPLAGAFADGSWEPIDPFEGIRDIQARRLRMISDRSFPQDPLRLLRAFRLSAQGGLTIEEPTLTAIEKYAHLLSRCAPERVHQEWLGFLSQKETSPHLQRMDETSLLNALFPELTRLKGLVQDGLHHLDAFDHCRLTLQLLEGFFQETHPLPVDLKKDLSPFFLEKRKKAWLKWAALFHDLGKALTWAEKEGGRRTFLGHTRASTEAFLSVVERLRVGNQERDFLLHLVGNHMRPLYLAREESLGTLTRRALMRLVREFKGDLSPLFLLALADSLAAQGPEKSSTQEEYLLAVWRKALSFRDDVLRPIEESPPLLKGTDLIALGLKPGPMFGTLLAELKEERLEGRVKTREEALAWLNHRLGVDVLALSTLDKNENQG